MSLVKLAFEYLGGRYVYNLWLQRSFSVGQMKTFIFNRRFYNVRCLHSPLQRARLIRNTDVFISGSDQIWNTFYRFDPTMFLDFAGGKRKIAYAASIGTDCIKKDYKEAVRDFLSDYYRIGVREVTAVRVLSALTMRNDIVCVIDPTFLLSPEQWRDVSDTAVIEKALPEVYILCYVIGENPEYCSQLRKVVECCDSIGVVIVPSQENPSFSLEGATVYRDAGPLEFVRLICGASFVCTDSFHATALCINLGKDFVEFVRTYGGCAPSQGSRIMDLLRQYNLLYRIYSEDSVAWASHIDYSAIQKLLGSERTRCVEFLTNAIED